MKLSIQHNIPDSGYKDLTVSFARYFVAADFSSRDVLSGDVYCTYWNDWEGLIRDHLQITFLQAS